MPVYDIPFNKPGIVGNEMQYMADAVASGHASGDGAYTKKCSALLEEALGVPKVLLTTNCTHALEMMALLLDIKPGDEVIVPSFTFVSTVNAFVLRGATPVFADIRPDTLNLDETRLETLITPRTRAIVPVHYAGVGCEMDAIMDIARPSRRGGGRGQRPRPVRGLQGQVPRHVRPHGDPELPRDEELHVRRGRRAADQRPGAASSARRSSARRAPTAAASSAGRSTSTPGSTSAPATCRPTFWRPSCTPSSRPATRSSRRAAASGRPTDEQLAAWAAANGVQLPTIPSHCEQPYHMFYLLLPSLDARTR